MRFKFLLIALLCSSLAFGAISVTDGRGKVIRLPKYPKRIVSITPSNTEILFALGLGSRIIGVTSRCDYPPQALLVKNKVGDLNTSVEKVASLKPDLVVGHSLLNKNANAALERLHVPVFAGDPRTLDEVMGFILKLGEITGTEKKAHAIVVNMKKSIASVRQRAAAAQTCPRVVFAVDISPLWVCGKGTFMDQLCQAAGAINVGNRSSGFYQASTEAVIARNPEYILVTHPNPMYYYRSQTWRIVAAVKNKKVIQIDPNMYTRTGPRLSQALVNLFDILHPGGR